MNDKKFGWSIASVATFLIAASLVGAAFYFLDEYEIKNAIYCFSFSFVAILLGLGFGLYDFLTNILVKQQKLDNLKEINETLERVRRDQETILQEIDSINQKIKDSE